ncbi:MAG: carboxypeptidase regulatory-like domain-containing protein [Oscillochloris sp.]|nr:carboxypeptidase regulatory-like domain-containing protein [Oscillochloris sp.]
MRFRFAVHLRPLVLLLLAPLILSVYAVPARAADPPFSLTHELVSATGDPLDVLVPGVRAMLRTRISNTSGSPGFFMLDVSGMNVGSAVATEAEARRIVRLAPGEQRTFNESLVDLPQFGDQFLPDLGDEVLASAVTACVLADLAAAETPCPNPASAPDQVITAGFQVPLRADDFGDAPDRTNNLAAPMAAYPATPANFPTVFNQAAGMPNGPRHAVPQPFHLGQRVSLEAEADIGPDQDPRNNIEPAANNPNNDRGDDGIRIDPASLAHCEPAKITAAVFASPNFLASAVEAGGVRGYLNVWIDGNRDGDWADAVACPTGAAAPGAIEHILIDAPIDLSLLAPGINNLNFTSNAVPWPANQAERPSWLRVTLSLEPSNKTLTAGNVNYGDGRGLVDAQGDPRPFRHGETEDYLINRNSAEAEPDLEVRKTWRIVRNADGEREVIWAIDYRNRGAAPATDVLLTDALDGQNIIAILIGVRSNPQVPVQQNANALNFRIGTVAPGAEGRILIRTELPAAVFAGATITNTATISAAADAVPGNNSATATLELPLPKPLILSPGSGATCAPNLTVSGLAIPGATVTLRDQGGILADNIPVDANGRWQAEVTLSAGRHLITAQASLNGRTSRPADPIRILVDPSLPFDPLSMSFKQPLTSTVTLPVGPNDFLGADGWRVRLKPETTYRFEVRICCETPGAQVALKLGDAAPIALSDPDSNGIYSGEFTTGPNGGTVSFTVIVVCAEVRTEHSGEARPAPATTIVDAFSGEPIPNARIALQPQDHDGELAALLPYIEQENLYFSDGAGAFTPPQLPGYYRVRVAAEGYQPYVGREPLGLGNFEIQDFRVQSGSTLDYHWGPLTSTVRLTPRFLEDPRYRVALDELGFQVSSLKAQPGAIVEFQNLDVWERSVVSPRDAASGQATGKRVAQTGGQNPELESGLLAPGASYLRRFDEPGVYTVTDAETGTTMTVVVSHQVYLPMLMR